MDAGCPTCHKMDACFIHVISCNPHYKPVRLMLYSPFYRGGNRCSERLNSVSQSAQLLSDRVRTGAQVSLVAKTMLGGAPQPLPTAATTTTTTVSPSRVLGGMWLDTHHRKG